MNLWYVVGIPALLILAFVGWRFVGYKLEADAEDRAEPDEKCERTGVPVAFCTCSQCAVKRQSVPKGTP